jgi:hypothetical protein
MLRTKTKLHITNNDDMGQIFFFPVRWHKVNDVLRTITDRPNPDTSALKSQKIITNDDSANPLKD